MNDNAKNSLLVSVVIPCYKQAHFLHEAIESVLNQTYRNFEIIVVDDGSPDNASEVAARYPEVRCVRQENRGLPGARNAGFYLSKGDYLKFLDSDDRLLPNALEIGVNSLNTHPECGYVTGQYCQITAEGKRLPCQPQLCTTKPEDHYLPLLRFDHTWNPLVVMFQRRAFESVGGYDTSPSIKGCEDYDICIRIASKSSAYCYNEVTAEYRLHGTSMSGNSALIWTSALNVLRSQRNLIKGSRRKKEAYNMGFQRINELYGEHVIYHQISSPLQARHELKKALNSLVLVARYYPQGLIKYIYRQLFRAVRPI